MMKQRRSASSLRPSKLSRFLLAVLVLKLSVLGVMLFEYALPDFSALSIVKTVEASPAAPQGEQPAAPAAPAAAPVTPPSSTNPLEAGMIRGGTGAESSVGTFGASPGATAAPATDSSGRTLPPISMRQPSAQPAPGSGPSANSTAALGRETLALRQEELARKEQELRALENDISAKLEQMELLESRLKNMMKEADDVTDAKFRHTVDVLTNMKAKQAAAVLATLDERIAVKVLAGMRGRQAGEILTFVDPQKAARLTESLVRMQLPFE